MRILTARWPGQPSVPTDLLVELRVRPPSLLPYSANVKLTARLSALAVRKIFQPANYNSNNNFDLHKKNCSWVLN